MSLVTALYQESTMYYNGLLEDEATGTDTGTSAIETPFTFIIPVYKNMPETPCERPTGDGNPNAYLSQLILNGQVLEGFVWKKTEYSITVEEEVDRIQLDALPITTKASVSGTGEYLLIHGETVCTVKCKAQDGTIVKYTLKVTRKGEGEDPVVTPTPVEEEDVFVTPTPVPATASPSPVPATPTPTPAQETITSETFQVNEKQISNIALGTDVTTLLAGLSVSGDGTKAVYNAKGETVTEGLVGTGYTLKTRNFTIPIVIYGDVDGDGEVTAKDLLYVRRHILGIVTLKDSMAVAADVKDADGINAVDMLYIRRQLLGISQIEQKR